MTAIIKQKAYYYCIYDISGIMIYPSNKVIYTYLAFTVSLNTNKFSELLDYLFLH